MSSNNGGPRRRNTPRRAANTPQIPTPGLLQPSPKWMELLNNSPLVVIVFITVQAGWTPLYVCALTLLLIAASALRSTLQPRSV